MLFRSARFILSSFVYASFARAIYSYFLPHLFALRLRNLIIFPSTFVYVSFARFVRVPFPICLLFVCTIYSYFFTHLFALRLCGLFVLFKLKRSVDSISVLPPFFYHNFVFSNF